MDDDAKRHGSFDSLPVPDRKTTVRDALIQFPGPFAELSSAELASFDSNAAVDVEADTGAMTVYDPTGSGAHWVYFPGEGWDAC